MTFFDFLLKCDGAIFFRGPDNRLRALVGSPPEMPVEDFVEKMQQFEPELITRVPSLRRAPAPLREELQKNRVVVASVVISLEVQGECD
jgi:hypothetical protein